MDQISVMCDDIRKLKEIMDSVFEKIEKHTDTSPYELSDAYAEKDRIIEALNQLSAKMTAAELDNFTSSPTKNAIQEDITQLKQRISVVETERQNIQRRAGASLKGIL